MMNPSKQNIAIGLKPDPDLGLVPLAFLVRETPAGYNLLKTLNHRDLSTSLEKEFSFLPQIIKIVSFFEPESLLKTLDKKAKKIKLKDFLKTADRKIIKHLDNLSDNRRTELMELIQEHRLPVFLRFDRHQELRHSDLLGFWKNKAEVRFFFESRQQTLHYRLRMSYEDEPVDLIKDKMLIFTNKKASVIWRGKFLFFENPLFNGNKLKPFLTKEEVVVKKELQGVFFEKFLLPAVKNFDYSITGFDFTERKAGIKALLIAEKTFTGKAILRPVFEYGEHKVDFYLDRPDFVAVKKNSQGYYLEKIRREFDKESRMLLQLEESGFSRGEKYFYLPDNEENAVAVHAFLIRKLKELEAAGFKVVNFLFNREPVMEQPQIEYGSRQKIDWFDLYVTIEVGGFTLKFNELRDHILNKEPQFVLPDGRVFIIPETWFNELSSLAWRMESGNRIRLHRNQLSLLRDHSVLLPDATIARGLKQMEVSRPLQVPSSVKARLRPYQITGFQWLYHLTQNRFGVCLADDMGLGKTLQVLTLLQYYFDGHSLAAAPAAAGQLSLFDTPADAPDNTAESALLVVPKSLIYNWVDEIKKFTPALDFAVYHGPGREEVMRSSYGKRPLIITTYGVVRADIGSLENRHFSYVVLDESQAIKNPSSLTFKAVMRLPSSYRVVMTGTPVENYLTDLWAQMHFLNRELLGSLSWFVKRYQKEIEKGDKKALAELRKITSPFILRRLKKEVARELPEKIEQTVFCELSDAQQQLYERYKSAIRNEIAVGSSHRKQLVTKVLAMLMKLRQITLHPVLTEDDYTENSGKYDAVISTIETLLEEGHRFLIFSSFVKYLELFEAYFQQRGIRYSKLTGSSRHRQQIVEEYQNDAAIQPFLISIKAGGTGLNITAADYVLITDPWWNPQVERQAIDRTHRIGQKQTVNVMRFITKNTVEEKMMALQKSKSAMSEQLIATSPATLQLDDILKLVTE